MRLESPSNTYPDRGQFIGPWFHSWPLFAHKLVGPSRHRCKQTWNIELFRKEGGQAKKTNRHPGLLQPSRHTFTSAVGFECFCCSLTGQLELLAAAISQKQPHGTFQFALGVQLASRCSNQVENRDHPGTQELRFGGSSITDPTVQWGP